VEDVLKTPKTLVASAPLKPVAILLVYVYGLKAESKCIRLESEYSLVSGPFVHEFSFPL
jgi:hypothetical protein